MKNLKPKVAAAITVAGLGGLTGLALSQDGNGVGGQSADGPVVRPEVIRRTVHVSEHPKPRHLVTKFEEEGGDD